MTVIVVFVITIVTPSGGIVSISISSASVMSTITVPFAGNGSVGYILTSSSSVGSVGFKKYRDGQRRLTKG